jgi:hypothetical protein
MVNFVIRIRIAVLSLVLYNREFTIPGPTFIPGTFRVHLVHELQLVHEYVSLRDPLTLRE